LVVRSSSPSDAVLNILTIMTDTNLSYLGPPSTPFDNPNEPLLNKSQSETLDSFFVNGFEDASYVPEPEHINTSEDNECIHPANLHRIQLAYKYGYSDFAAPRTPHNHMFNTHADLQAADTLSNYAQMPQPQLNGRSHSYHGLPSSSSVMQTNPREPHLPPRRRPPIVELNILPNYNNNTPLPNYNNHTPLPDYNNPLGLYAYGTDSSFNEAGYHNPSHSVPQSAALLPNRTELHGSDDHDYFISSFLDDSPPNDEQKHSEDSAEDGCDEEDAKPAPRRRKPKRPAVNGKRKNSSEPTPNSSDDEPAPKKKRGCIVGQKPQRQNLTEDQKRNNHILSEQKRRNLIQRGNADFVDIVPAVHNGGLNKSTTLYETAEFVLRLEDDNKALYVLIYGDEE
jgi:hypothetical protein